MNDSLPDPEQLRRVNALLEAALELPAERREGWLRALQASDLDLQPLLRRLLERAGRDADRFMRHAPGLEFAGLVALVDDGDADPIADAPGDVVGPYRLLRPLGEGGMATVWLAERIDGSLQRQEALKLPRSGWAIGLAQRMARERDILATLEHPHIARLYDAGVTAAGRPWLAMEHVTGVPIDQHCRAQGLDVPARLRLFLQVAEAASHAHARLVVHRDLKPSNILVTAAGEVRLLDFGVAQLLHDDSTVRGTLTQLIGRAVTPDYAAPEQLSGRPVGVAADVYSLGVVLHELLAGVRPYRLSRDTPAALEEAILSADLHPASSQCADPRTARALRGDLDTILFKAMRKDPAQRYRSVEAFAADIERHLAGEPVQARPAGLAYRLGKFVRRHSAGVIAGTAVVAALVAGTALATWQAREAARERDQARALLARNEAVNEFLGMLFTEAAAPEHADAIRQMLERGALLVSPAFGQKPEHEAAILRILSEYFDEPQRSDALLARAAEITRQSADRTLRAQIDCDRGQTLQALGRSDEAVALVERWLREPGTPEVAAVHCLQMRGAIAAMTTEPTAALSYAQAALQRLRQAGLGGGDVEADLLGDIGFALHQNSRSAEAEAYFEESMQRFAALQRLDSLHARVMLNNWGVVELTTGEVLRALQRYDALLASHRRLMAWREPLSWLLGNRALALERIGRLDDALLAYEETLRASEAVKHQHGTQYGLVGMASVQLAQGRVDEADRLLARASALGGDAREPASIRGTWVQARLDLQRGRAAQAHAALEKQLAFLRSINANQYYLAMNLRTRAEAALALARHDDALADAREALSIAQRLQGGKPHSDQAGLAWLTLGRVELAGGRPDAARQAFEQGALHLAGATGADSPESQQARALAKAASAN
ncbi:MAG: protein kinase [Piscinibacter sp.]